MHDEYVFVECLGLSLAHCLSVLHSCQVLTPSLTITSPAHCACCSSPADLPDLQTACLNTNYRCTLFTVTAAVDTNMSVAVSDPAAFLRVPSCTFTDLEPRWWHSQTSSWCTAHQATSPFLTPVTQGTWSTYVANGWQCIHTLHSKAHNVILHLNVLYVYIYPTQGQLELLMKWWQRCGAVQCSLHCHTRCYKGYTLCTVCNTLHCRLRPYTRTTRLRL